MRLRPHSPGKQETEPDLQRGQDPSHPLPIPAPSPSPQEPNCRRLEQWSQRKASAHTPHSSSSPPSLPHSLALSRSEQVCRAKSPHQNCQGCPSATLWAWPRSGNQNPLGWGRGLCILNATLIPCTIPLVAESKGPDFCQGAGSAWPLTCVPICSKGTRFPPSSRWL